MSFRWIKEQTWDRIKGGEKVAEDGDLRVKVARSLSMDECEGIPHAVPRKVGDEDVCFLVFDRDDNPVPVDDVEILGEERIKVSKKET